MTTKQALERCPFCADWRDPRYCGHYLVDGQLAPAGYLPRWFEVLGANSRVGLAVVAATKPGRVQ